MLKQVSRFVLTPLARGLFRAKILGRNNVPREGAVILASNHLSFIDSVIITLFAPRSVSFLAKESYFTTPGVKGTLSRLFFSSIGAIPVSRGVGQAAQNALDSGLSLLHEGEAFAVYPEGTRSRDGKLYRGKTGVAWLALNAGVPVVPVGLKGTDKVQPVGTSGIRPAKVSIEFGEPLDLSRHGSADSGRARRHATDEVMDAIAALSGQERAEGFNEPPAKNLVERVRRGLFGRNRL
ncbi:lysophospholipid acyltransferase family protein [Pontimonas sp.]|nr:lysophospholipid acyltransferase family protein [Pontimonas sp.]